MRGQTTKGGYFCAGGGHPDYYAYEAGAGSRSISSRKQEQDMMRQQEPDYCQNLTHPKLRYAPMQQDDTHPDYQAAAPGRQTTTQTTTPDYHIRACSRTREGSPRIYVTSAISSRRITRMQQDNTTIYKQLQKLQKNATKAPKLDNFCQILTQN